MKATVGPLTTLSWKLVSVLLAKQMLFVAVTASYARPGTVGIIAFTSQTEPLCSSLVWPTLVIIIMAESSLSCLCVWKKHTLKGAKCNFPSPRGQISVVTRQFMFNSLRHPSSALTPSCAILSKHFNITTVYTIVTELTNGNHDLVVSKKATQALVSPFTGAEVAALFHSQLDKSSPYGRITTLSPTPFSAI